MCNRGRGPSSKCREWCGVRGVNDNNNMRRGQNA